MGQTPRDIIGQARESLRMEDLPRARRLLQGVLPLISADGELLAQAGLLLLRAGSYSAALSCVKRSVQVDPHAAKGANALADVLWSLGYRKDAIEAMAASLECLEQEEGKFLSAIRAFSSSGLGEQGAEICRLGLQGFPESLPIYKASLQFAKEWRMHAMGKKLLKKAQRLGAQEKKVALHYALDFGEFGELRALQSSLAKDDDVVRSCKLALWEGHTERALKCTETTGFPEEEGRHTVAIAHCLAGKWREGLSVLNELPATPERATWKSEALRHLGRAEESLRCAEQAKDRNGVRSLSAEINFHLSTFESDDLDGQVVLPKGPFEPILQRIQPMFPHWDGVWNGKVRFLRELFAVTLHRFRGNRTGAPTYVTPESDRLQSLQGSELLPGERLPLVLRRLFLESFDELDGRLAQFESYAPAVLARVELALRHGRVHEASERLSEYTGPQKKSLEAQLALMQGAYERATKSLEGEGDALSAWIRGEAMWRQGNLEEARTILLGAGGEVGRNTLRSRLIKAGLAENPTHALAELRIIFPVSARFIPAMAEDGSSRAIIEKGLEALGGLLFGGMESVRGDNNSLLGVNELS